eukprot:NODE_6074_length_1708_cov_5.762808.p1 GENE.NODE_6074_length_1708_cov_5.762808~~NODE_6074_length_1708_cov_5.762808.p1  ORF type:complete len:484 (+),score=159.40 NODE_6074_length_1708_cov_5.762808:130-1452(+)
MEDYCAKRIGLISGASATWPVGFRATVSSSSCPGEGEHKILSAVLRNDGEAPAPASHAIVGNDVDLLLSPLASCRGPRGIFVASPTGTRYRIWQLERLGCCIARQATRLIGAPLPSFSSTADAVVASFTNPEAATPTGTEEVPQPGEQKEAAQLALLRDFVLVGLLRGSDYLPCLMCEHEAEDLWREYLAWRRTAAPGSDAGLTEPEGGSKGVPGKERLTLCRDRWRSFMAHCAGRTSESSGDPPEGGVTAAAEAAAYLQGLLWCLEAIVNGRVPDYRFRPPKSLPVGASAALLAAAGDAVFSALPPARGPEQPLAPLVCALAMLPVASVRSLVLPAAPCLAPLLEVGSGLLGEVARLEHCTECEGLAAAMRAAPPCGKKATKRRRAFEVHRRDHSDIDAVDPADLENEVRRLCEASPEAATLLPRLAFAEEVVLTASPQ